MRRFVRETAFRMARPEILRFLEDYEEPLMVIFRQEMQKLDQRMPEERLFIDIHMARLGEELLKAILASVKRFLRET